MSNAATTGQSLQRNGFSAAHWETLAAIWVVYGSCYFCRSNIGSANPRLTAPQLGAAPLLDAAQMGLVLMGFKIAYGTGQFVNGQLSEWIGAKRIMLIGIVGAVLANVAFGFGIGLWSLLAAWALNGFFQSGLWPPCVKIMGDWFRPIQRGRAMGIIGTSYQLGTAATLAAMGYVIAAFGDNWRAAFFVPAGVFLLVALPVALWLRERSDANGVAAAGVPEAAAPRQPKAVLAAEILWLTLSNPRVWILGVGLAGLNVVRFGFLEWAPKHLLEVQSIKLSGASLQTAVLPFGGVLGVLAAGWVSDRVFQSRRAPVIACMLAGLGVLTLLYDWAAVNRGWPEIVLCLGAIGFFVYGPQVMLVGSAPQDLARRDATAAAAGFVDALGYAGAAAGSAVTGRLVGDFGWHTTIVVWACVAFATALVVSTLWHAKAE